MLKKCELYLWSISKRVNKKGENHEKVILAIFVGCIVCVDDCEITEVTTTLFLFFKKNKKTIKAHPNNINKTKIIFFINLILFFI